MVISTCPKVLQSQYAGSFTHWRCMMISFFKINFNAGFIALLGLALINGCNQTSGSNPQGKENSMLPATQTVVKHPPIPPMDAAAPRHYETATFAMG